MRIAALGLVAILAGCATTGPAASDVGLKPENWKEAAKVAAKSAYIDPYSVRDASISEPVPASMVFDGFTPIPHSGWMVCIRANAKNRMGAYTGQSVTGLLFQNGRVVMTLSEPEFAVAHHCGQRFENFTL